MERCGCAFAGRQRGAVAMTGNPRFAGSVRQRTRSQQHHSPYAAIDMQNAVARDPQDVRLLIRYANALWYAGRKAECKGVIERAFELRPHEPGLDPWLKWAQNPAPGAPN